MDRINHLSGQLNQKPRMKYITNNIVPASMNDVVICGAVRTPLTKAKKGDLKDTSPEILLQAALQGLITKLNIDTSTIQDIVVGNVNQPGAGAMTSKMSTFLAGFPETTGLQAVNRFCASGLEAIAVVAAKIRAGQIDVGIGAGVESMTMFDMNAALTPTQLSDYAKQNQNCQDCLLLMGITSENVVEKFGITRQQQDEFAAESHAKAAFAQENGLFKDEIVPVKTKVKRPGKEEYEDVVVTQDDGIRKNTTVEGLAKLKPVFKKDGSTTAGNSSQVTDGASAVLLCNRFHAIKMKYPILARFIDYTVVGVPPNIMGIGPALAIPQLLERVGLKKEEIGIFEINEAFASQCSYTVKKLGLDPKKVNPKGGAIALGHPLGCTGARQLATLLPEMKRQKVKYGIISMCTATGMGAAGLIEYELKRFL